MTAAPCTICGAPWSREHGRAHDGSSYTPRDLATSLRNCGDTVTLGGLGGLLALAGFHLLSLRSELPPPGCGPCRVWTALVARGAAVTEGSGETIALALAAACQPAGGGS